MAIGALRICVVALAGVALVAPAGGWAQNAPGACQKVGTSVCGTGQAVISNVSGDVSLGRGGAVNAVGGGSPVLAGDRILARDGTAQVSLGPNCSTSIPVDSISIVTREGGLTCLKPSNATAQATGGLDPVIVGGAAAALLVTGGVIALTTGNHNTNSIPFAVIPPPSVSP